MADKVSQMLADEVSQMLAEVSMEDGVDLVAVGIDFGTVNSSVAVWSKSADKSVEESVINVVPDKLGNHSTPSCVKFTDPGVLMGNDAMAEMSTNPEKSVFNFKRLMGCRLSDASVQSYLGYVPFKVVQGPNDTPMVTVTIKGEERQRYLEEIASYILFKMKLLADTYVGWPIKNVVVSVPPFFNDSQRQALVDAGTLSGLNILRITNDQSAAACAYLFEKMKKTSGYKNVLIFDLGGGTLGVSIFIIRRSTLGVKATAGDNNLGGVDFNIRMADHFVKEFKEFNNIDCRTSDVSMSKLMAACETAKIILSSNTQAKVEIKPLYGDVDFCSTITRTTFEELSKDLFERCMASVCDCLEDANMDKNQVHDVVLLGGSSEIPKMQELLQTYFDGVQISKGIDLHGQAVAYGAAVQAANLSWNRKAPKLVFSDISNFSIGVAVKKEAIYRIISKRSSIPAYAEKGSGLFLKNEDGDVYIYEGEEPKPQENNVLGKFSINDLPSSNSLVSFEIDHNGILQLSSGKKILGKKKKFPVSMEKRRLSEEDISNIKKKDSEDAESAGYVLKLYTISLLLEDIDSQKVAIGIHEAILMLSSTFHPLTYVECLDNIKIICAPIISKMAINMEESELIKFKEKFACILALENYANKMLKKSKVPYYDAKLPSDQKKMLKKVTTLILAWTRQSPDSIQLREIETRMEGHRQICEALFSEEKSLEANMEKDQSNDDNIPSCSGRT